MRLLILAVLILAGCGEADEGGDGGRDSSGCELIITGDSSQGSCAVGGGDSSNTQGEAIDEACDAQARAECVARGNPEAAAGVGDCYKEGLEECLGDAEEDEEEADAENDA